MRVRMIWLVLLAAAWTAPVAAQDQPAEGPTVDILAAAVAHEDRRLLTGCQPVYLDLELEDDKRSTDLTVDRIRTMAESRLRASRLLADEHSDVTLDVSVWVIGPAFYGNVSITQPVYLSLGNTWPNPLLRFVHEPPSPIELPGAFYYATTWNHHSLGTHSGDGGHILQALSESIDAFITEYLRVNEAACP